MLDIFDSTCILLAKAEQKHYLFTKKLLTDNPTWRFRPIFASASSVTP